MNASSLWIHGAIVAAARVRICACVKLPRFGGLSQTSGVDDSSGMAVNFALRFGGDPMILSAIAERLKRRSKDDFKGRHFEASSTT